MKNTIIKKVSIVVMLLTSLSITACTKNSNENTEETEQTNENIITIDYKENEFITPSNETIKYSEKYKHQFDSSDIEVEQVNEIKLKGNKMIYETQGDVIKYNNREYIGLYEIINTLEKPCSTEALINFILEYFNPTYDKIYCQLEYEKIDYDNLILEEGGEIIDEGSILISESTDIDKIYERYNKEVDWSIKVYDVNSDMKMYSYVILHGCSDYIVGQNLDREISKDYGEATIEPIKATPEENTEPIEENTEPIEENTEPIEKNDRSE